MPAGVAVDADAGLARFVGRVGALAVALGVGVAVASDGTGVAWAEDGDGAGGGDTWNYDNSGGTAGDDNSDNSDNDDDGDAGTDRETDRHRRVEPPPGPGRRPIRRAVYAERRAPHRLPRAAA